MPSPLTAARHDPYAALRTPNFRWFVVNILTLTIAVQIQGVVVAWQIYEVTHDPLSLGMIGLAEALPFIGVALYAGHVADRVDRRWITLVSAIVLLGCSIALLVITIRWQPLGTDKIWAIYGVIVVSGVARSFLQPARTALGAELVPRALYVNAVAWRSSTWQFGAVVGPAIGGLLYGFGGATLSYAIDAGLMVVAAASLMLIRHVPPIRGEDGEPVMQSLLTGIRFVWREPIILGALTLDLFAVLFGGAVALLPVFAGEILKVGPSGLGVLRAAPAAGAVLMSVVLAYRPPFERTGRVLLGSVAAFGLCMIGFGLSRQFGVSVALLALSGMVDQISVVVRSTLLQIMTPEHLLGRVSAVNAIFIGSSNEIGAFESGVAAKLLGTVRSVVLGGIATLGVVAVVGARVPALRRLARIT